MNDDELEQAFDEIRARDAERAPPFMHVWTARRPARFSRAPLLLAAAVVSMIALVWITRPAPKPILVGLAHDPEPLAFLLVRPGGR